MNNPAIVVVAYNRPASLQRLLDSIAVAQYSGADIPLIISIDRSEDSKTQIVANNFEWKHGEKTIILAEEHLGLKNHVLKCGQLTQEHENIIVLEDDLMVSPDFYSYAQEAISFYKDSSNVACISLYNYQVTESSFQPFHPIEDGSDVYFMRFTSSWGQIWSQKNWVKFKEWLVSNQNGKPELLPKYIQDWGGNSWKKLFINFMLDQDLYTAFPRVSYTTNFEDPGTHASTKGLFQVPLGRKRDQIAFTSVENAKSIYDEYFEVKSSILKKAVPALKDYEFEVDLLGGKELESIRTSYVLTNRSGKIPELTFSDELTPDILNVIHGVKGDAIKLIKKENIQKLSQDLNDVLEVDVVIPIEKFNEEAFRKSLDSIDGQTYKANCIVVAIEDHLNLVDKIRSDFNSNITLIRAEEDLQSMLKKGLRFAKSEVVTWIKCGHHFEADAFVNMNKILSRFSHINYLNSSSNSKNLAPFRWTLSKAVKLRKSAKAINTEGWFCRSAHLNSVLEEEGMDQYDLALRILQRDFVFTSSKALFRSTDLKRPLSEKESKIDVQNVKRPLTRKVLSSSFKWFYEKNITLMRFIYVESEGINPVVRYDAKYDSFYLARY